MSPFGYSLLWLTQTVSFLWFLSVVRGTECPDFLHPITYPPISLRFCYYKQRRKIASISPAFLPKLGQPCSNKLNRKVLFD